MSLADHEMRGSLPVRGEWVARARRIVVKLGTGVLTNALKQPDLRQFRQLVRQMARQREAGREVIVVTSGAVGAGMGVLGFDKRPRDTSELQACAAVGQSRLMAMYQELFAEHQLHVAQVLLTHDDLQDHDRHLNGRKTITTLLKHGVIPIINENDAVSSTELKFGDNDRLSALVTALVPADLLVILTTVEGVIRQFGTPSACVIPEIGTIDRNIEQLAGGTSSVTAVGGMRTKIQAARILMRSGIPMVIASGREETVLASLFAGKPVGTLFVPQHRKLSARKRWIAFFHHARGVVQVDEGARRALAAQGGSLLQPGIVRVEGHFEPGDILSVRDKAGAEFARGISRCSDAELLAGRAGKEVIHRDDLVIL